MMTSANQAMATSYDGLQAALSVLIAISASYAAMELTGEWQPPESERMTFGWLAEASFWALAYGQCTTSLCSHSTCL